MEMERDLRCYRLLKSRAKMRDACKELRTRPSFSRCSVNIPDLTWDPHLHLTGIYSNPALLNQDILLSTSRPRANSLISRNSRTVLIPFSKYD
ncbi:uncharacterized protein BO72DRAFT_269336 [Aspergillus fijiensis CBS 313.89]|uniref:Uncharacterized protein n=1 Tax=Aspergillus fijiensis CBS 313.89 TaxID=1448319 RepID=A0A8G1RGY7_9EURO|nr:uncharacterized protein BO72DRAFT_269336 [Aspergillus fijiensis CBS 313.89]RAK72659.1 hypothetical protein BO72DRAFT_269336 [Aspergillus fijiensis CBS 313.89]